MKSLGNVAPAELPGLGWLEGVDPRFAAKTIGQLANGVTVRAANSHVPGSRLLGKVDPRLEARTIGQLADSLSLRTANYQVYKRMRRIAISDQAANAAMAKVVSEKAPDVSTFVQIGAHDGVFDDPFNELITQNGWSALLVEPQRGVFQALEVKYAGSQNVRCLRAAVGSSCGTLTLHRALLGGDRADFGTAIAAGDPGQVRAEIERCVGRRAARKAKLETEDVPMLTLSAILDSGEIDGVDFLASDTEGYDATVVRDALSECGLRPPLLQYEHLHLEPAVQSQVLAELACRGYETVTGHHKDTLAYL